jgi:hypothetical protein
MEREIFNKAVKEDWDAEEERAGAVTPELRRLARRALRRPLLTLVVAIALSAAATGMRSRKPRVYESRIAFRITESDLDANTNPRTVGNLRNYVWQVCFSNPRLLSVIRAHHLYPAPMKRHDETEAVDEMRDDIDVEVWRNFFVFERSPDDPGRSARMAVTYHGLDRTVVYDVVRDLARLVTEEEETSRIEQAEGALNDADDRVKEARQLAQERHHDVVVEQVALQNARNAEQSTRLTIEAQSLQRTAHAADEEVAKAEKGRQALWMRLQLEKRRLGLQFELIDSGRVAPPGPSKKLVLTLIAIIAFMLTLPLSMLGIGAIDTRVYEAEDVQRLGLDAIGELPRFGGDNRGSLVDRLRDEKRRGG